MNTKKQYMVPATEVLDIEVQLMIQAVSMGGDSNTPSAPTWSNDDGDSQNAGEGW